MTKIKQHLPSYVWMVSANGKHRTALSLVSISNGGVEYYRPAGAWSVGVKEKGGKLYSTSTHHRSLLSGKLLEPCTEEEFILDNLGYL